MNKVIRFGGAVALALLWSGTALADGYNSPSAAPRPFSWTGFYAGVNLGYGQHDDDVNFTADPVVFLPGIALRDIPRTMIVNNRGMLGGAQLGYNWQVGGNWLVGVEADFDWSRLDGANSVTDVNFGIFNTTVEHKIDSFGTLRARVGLIALPNVLLYGTGGLAFGDTRLNLAVTNLASCALFPGCLTGYLYADLGSRSATVTFAGGPPGNFYTASSEFQEHIFRTGVNFKFGAHD
jgi:outer membrane immunogenic protein